MTAILILWESTVQKDVLLLVKMSLKLYVEVRFSLVINKSHCLYVIFKVNGNFCKGFIQDYDSMHDIVTLVSYTSRTDLWHRHKTSCIKRRITGERVPHWYFQLYIPFPLGFTMWRKGNHEIFNFTARSHYANTEHLRK